MTIQQALGFFCMEETIGMLRYLNEHEINWMENIEQKCVT